MKSGFYVLHRLTSLLVLLIVMLSSALLPATATLAATATTATLFSVGDTRLQGGSPDQGFGDGFIWVGSPNGHLALVQFDLSELPPNATISSAELQLNFTGVYSQTTVNVEVGRNDGAWDEETTTWNTKPANSFNNNTKPVGTTAGDIAWPVTGIVQQWYNGTQPNNGFALKGDGELKAFHSRETSPDTPNHPNPYKLPRLVVTYTVPIEEGLRSDLGDAPDSSNNVGVNPNTAYPGTPGNFPTVWNGTPAGQAAGPRHANQRFEGILGQALSRELEADNGPDADGPNINNILNGGADNADNDRADDGWRNRNAAFPHCQTTTLRVRVSKGANAELNRMYLNVWFDGNRDGDWADRALCTPEDETLQIPAYEWLVQDYFVDMTGIPAGGFVDIDVTTTTILNTTPEQRHWMRFTLSEEKTPKSPNGRTDGRGPHPDVGSFRFGETEDVLQRPAIRGEDGELKIRKIAITDAQPIEHVDYFTYKIRLRHEGGSQPIQARIRDVLPYPMVIVPSVGPNGVNLIHVTSSTGGVMPLQATRTLELPPNGGPPQWVVNWRGMLFPEAEVELTFQVLSIALCEPNQITKIIRNVAQAQAKNGQEISDQVDVTADCPGFNPADLDFIPVDLDSLDLNDLSHVPWGSKITNNHPFTVSVGLFNKAIGNGTKPGDLLETITFAPGASRNISITLPLDQGRNNPLEQIDPPTPIQIGFCYLFPEANVCPDPVQHPNYHGDAPPFDLQKLTNDLGDAPDSTNHPGVAMLAYPGTPATFPTVFDPATGAPSGPKHTSPRPFHLGPLVSLEGEADIGPDQDPLNNIEPAANDPDNDRFDDGVQPNLWTFNNCQTTVLPVRIFISPAAAAWFQQQERPGYVNVWIDSNRDGDWADATACGGGPDGGGVPAVEHIVIDAPINVVALGAGLHVVNVPTGRVPWPAQLADKPAWVRVTLSEQLSNKTLQAGNLQYGDGRGYQQPFRTGETEDYLRRANADAQADLGVQLAGRLAPDAGPNNADLIGFQIEYGNVGDKPAEGGKLTFTKPTQLKDLRLTTVRAPGIPSTDIRETDETVTIMLPTVPPGRNSAIVLGWQIPDNQPPSGDYSAGVEITLTGDASNDNNKDRITLEAPVFIPSVAIKAGDGSIWGMAETTCRSQIELTGNAQPNVAFDLWLDGANIASLVSGITPYLHPRDTPADGRHVFWVTPNASTDPNLRSASLRLNVDRSLTVDPLSLTFTNSQGRVYHPPTYNLEQLLRRITAVLRSGETYEIAINRCGTNPSQQIELVLPNGTTIELTDPDGDGRYTGTMVFDESGSINGTSLAATTDLQLVSMVGGNRQSLTIAVENQATKRVLDASTGQPLADASVTLLSTSNAAVPAAQIGSNNPQTTGADGGFSFATISGFRLLVSRTGYQSYRSWDLNAAQDVRLTPELAGTPKHTVYITANGFEPAEITVQPGDLIEWVNLDLGEQGVSGTGIDSGALAAGQSYRARAGTSGSITVTNPADPDSPGKVIVEGQKRVFVPVITR
jgi:plastocyanin